MDKRRDVLVEIDAERFRQREKWGDEHDNDHEDGAIAVHAALLALGRERYCALSAQMGIGVPPAESLFFRLSDDWNITLKKWDRRRQLVVAGALIVSEIERLDRAKGDDESS